MLLGYLIYLVISGDAIGPKQDAQKTEDNPKITPTNIKQNLSIGKTDRLVVTQYKELEHPLKSQCKKFEYSGNVTIRTDVGLYDIQHMVNCHTGEYKEKEISNGDRTITYEDEVIKTLNDEYLLMLGYRLVLKHDVPILSYNNQDLYMSPL